MMTNLALFDLVVGFSIAPLDLLLLLGDKELKIR